VLRRIREGHGLACRLAAMGFVPGVNIDVHQNDHRGPVVVGLKSGRVVLGRRMAQKMVVE
jgi:Fe2+ transport system protein FeoA